MKTLLCTLLAAASLGTGAGVQAESVNNSQQAPYVAPRVFKVKTTEVQVLRELRRDRNEAGDTRIYNLTVVIYQELYSDGTVRTRKHSFRSGTADQQS